jgi:hypothetical protein
MIKQISIIALVVIGIGALGTILTPAFATVLPSHTGNQHGEWGNPGNLHQPKGPILITCIVGKGCIERTV